MLRWVVESKGGMTGWVLTCAHFLVSRCFISSVLSFLWY